MPELPAHTPRECHGQEGKGEHPGLPAALSAVCSLALVLM